MWSTTMADRDGNSGGSTVTFDDAKRMSLANQKDFESGPFDVAPSLFRRPEGADWVSERINRYFIANDILPLMVQDNYLNATPVLDPAVVQRNRGSNETAALEYYAAAADAISDGDIISEALMSEQNFSLMPAHGVVSTVLPAYLTCGGLNGRIFFPSYLSKLSTTGKNYRLLGQIKALMSAEAPASQRSLALYHLPAVRAIAAAKLRRAEEGGDKKALAAAQSDLGAELEDEMGMIKDDWEAVVAMGQAFAPADVSKRLGKVSFRGKRQQDQAAKTKVLRFGSDKSKVSSTRRGAKTEEEEEEEAEGEIDDAGGDDDDAVAETPVAAAT